MTMQAADLTVRKTVKVAAPLERAFEVFTDKIGTWWPFDRYSIGEGRTETAVMEGREGGRVYEVIEGGEEAYWATVTAWEPPRRLVLSWKVNPQAPAATEIEVRFSQEGEGTLVELEHRGWERWGDKAEEASRGYRDGWDTVLRLYAEVAEQG